jgi:hypothetical protein
MTEERERIYREYLSLAELLMACVVYHPPIFTDQCWILN